MRTDCPPRHLELVTWSRVLSRTASQPVHRRIREPVSTLVASASKLNPPPRLVRQNASTSAAGSPCSQIHQVTAGEHNTTSRRFRRRRGGVLLDDYRVCRRRPSHSRRGIIAHVRHAFDPQSPCCGHGSPGWNASDAAGRPATMRVAGIEVLKEEEMKPGSPGPKCSCLCPPEVQGRTGSERASATATGGSALDDMRAAGGLSHKRRGLDARA